jgi:hypothetical protein
MMATPGSHVAIYGQEFLASRRIVICEGEFDRLVLETKDFHAVTSTGGTVAFPEEWASLFFGIPEVSRLAQAAFRTPFGVRQAATLATDYVTTLSQNCPEITVTG